MFYDALAAEVASLMPNETKRRDQLGRDVWKAYGAGHLTDEQAQALAELVMPRRQAVPIGQVTSLKRYSIQRSPEQRSPDRAASIKRRRLHASTGPLPPNIAANFTTGELACLKIIADEFLAHGVCDLTFNEIGSRAGTCRSIAKQAVKAAELYNSLITVERRPRSGRKHLSNIIRIVRAEWLDWLAKGSRKGAAIRSCENAKPDFKLARRVKKNPPRSQIFKHSGSEPVDEGGEEENRSGA